VLAAVIFKNMKTLGIIFIFLACLNVLNLVIESIVKEKTPDWNKIMGWACAAIWATNATFL
jgi:hypothetical protein